MKILIIQQKRIGDVLTSSILCNNLKIKYPTSTIDYMCYSNCVDVLINNPNIDSIIELKEKTRKSYLSLFKFIFKIRAKKYDVVIDVYNKLETNLITLFSGANYKISYHKWYSSLFYTHNLKRFDNSQNTKYGFAIENRLLLLEPLGLDKTKINPFPKLYVSSAENQEAISIFEQHNIKKGKKNVMISLLGSEVNKTYPLEYMAKVVDYVAEGKDINIFFNYLPNQINDAKKVYDSCSKNTKEKIYFDLLGGNLRSFISIMNQCDVIIGNDGGAINMAKALNKPSFIIFSPFVEKKIWATFEDGLKNISVHLNDYEPELIQNLTTKELKKIAFSLYQKFTPELFKDKIDFFKEKNL